MNALAHVAFNKITLLLLIVLAVVWLIVGKPVTQGVLNELEKMRIIPHAYERHGSDEYNPDKIKDMMVTGKCVPRDYLCADGSEILYCLKEGHPDKAFGVLIGRAARVIVTAYEGKTNYWQRRCP